MLPEFPDFKNIEITDKEEIENFTKNYPPYSDFNFVSLFCWDVDNKRKISMLNGNLVVRSSDDVTGKEFITFLGTNKVPETVKELLKFCRKNRIKQELRMIPEETVKLINPKELGVDVREDRDQFDYVYETKELSCFPGSKYGDARNLNNRFIKKYGNDFEVKLFDLNEDNNKNCLMDLCKEWSEIKEIYINREEIAIQRLFKDLNSFDLINIMIYVRGNPIAFTINEILGNNIAISHFAKANYLYSGVNATLLKETSLRLLELGNKSLNYEEDLGLPGLRRAKKSFSPIYFLKKYKVSMRSGIIERLKSMLY